MLTKFVDLNRKFNRVPKIDSDEKDLSEFYSIGITDGTAWDQLLNYTRVIILAEAGSGKTKEIKNQAEKLKNSGKPSFFLRLEDIQNDFDFAFEHEGGSSETFKVWLANDEVGYFFLDSVDEAKLKNERDFKNAIRAFKAKLGSALYRAKFFITSRGSAWRATSDLQFVNEQLFKSVESSLENDSEQGFQVFTFNHLSKNEIKEFSKAYGVEDVEEFYNQLKINEAEDFANKPLDLIDLVNYWKNFGQIDNRFKLVENSINIKILTKEIGRDLIELPFDKLSEGAEEIAAAMIFCKLSKVSEFGSEPNNVALKIEQILKGWTRPEIETLLSRPIFEPSIYGTSRFSHRLIREFLAAKWIKKRVDVKSINQEQLYSLFYKSIYKVEILVPSLKPVLAWYVLLDKEFASFVIDKSPQVFIEGGDSSMLPAEVRKQLISKFCELYSQKEQCFISFDSAAIKRFSTPEMGGLVNKLLLKYYDYKDLRQILLQIAASSAMPECLNLAIKMSFDFNIEPFSLTLALRLINAVADVKFKLEHAISVLDHIPSNSERMLSVIIAELGGLLPISKILHSVSTQDEPNKRRYRDIQYHIERFAEGVNLDQSIEGLEFLYELINARPYKQEYRYEISEKNEWLMGIVQVLLINILSSKNSHLINKILLDSLTKASSYSKASYRIDGKRNDKIAELVNDWQELKGELFWFEVCQSRARLINKQDGTGGNRTLDRWFQVGAFRSYWKFNYRDLDAAIEWINVKELNDDKFVAFSLAWTIVKEEGRKPLMKKNLIMWLEH